MLARIVSSAVLLSSLLLACAGASDDPASDESNVTSGAGSSIQASPDDPCKARLIFLQKDAYKEGGRTNQFWPPHTTTILEVSCTTKDGVQTARPFEENHGTKPGTKDATGKEVLEEVQLDPKLVTAEAPWRDMQKLLASYQSCECEPDGFLSLDKVGQEVAGMVEKLLEILDCPEGDEVLLDAIRKNDKETLKRIVPQCRLKEDTSVFKIGVASVKVAKDVKETFEAHHVCNNDAALQVDLWKRFKASRDARACDPKAKAFCSGPKLYFNPNKELD